MYNLEYDELYHYGIKRRSGRYPWGSGEQPYQHSTDFLARIDELKKSGMSEKEIAESFGLSTTQFRAQRSMAKDERRALQVATAKRLRDKEGMNNSEIGRKMGLNESTVRSLLNENSALKMNAAKTAAGIIRKAIDEKGIIDIGTGVERELNISREKLNEALAMLELEGYVVYGGGVQQATNPGQQTNLKVICPPGTEHKQIYDYANVNSLKEYVMETEEKQMKSLDPNFRVDKPSHFVYPASLDSKRLQIVYDEEGGTKKDGVIELRRGVKDLDLGESHYAQVRIMVDNKSYLKGMAIYSDDLPDGIDVRFNTNKAKGTPMEKVLKDIKPNPENPFGALIKEGGQSYWYDEKGKQHLSLINKRAEEGDWGEWSNNLPSQFLAKQNTSLIKRQLDIAKNDRQSEFDEICSLTNPTVKKKLLESFAEDCDSAAVHLKAAALPRQSYQVILPIPELKDTEIYAPNYRNGEKVALIRFPHGGTFEIPILTVNNKHKKAKSIIGNAKDAVGINSSVAERLSGADFDGDTVMVVPTNSRTKITSTPPLKGLEGFDPKKQYPYKEGMKVMKATGQQMGIISNLITDMNLKGASEDELARAVRHSMVVIDAEKHKLNYKQSEIDNDIAGLKERYQKSVDSEGNIHYGAGTLLSRAKSQVSVPKRKGNAWINEDTGALEWERINKKTGEKESKYVDETYVDKKTGKTVKRTQKSTKMYETSDARTLSTGHPKEELYADYANYMKSLGNKARKEMISTGNLQQNKEAKEKYKKEVAELKAALNVALKNAPRERKAQLMANSVAKAIIADNPDITKKELKKLKTQALTKARLQVGASKQKIEITEKQWEAIQAGAISENRLKQILNNADIDKVREYATPKNRTVLSSAKIGKLKTMLNSGNYTTAEVAQALGISTSTVKKYM